RVAEQRPGEGSGALERAEVTGRELDFRAELELRPAREHVDDAGRGVLAEQGALRALQDLDALDLAQVAEADAVTRPVDAVDHHAHGRLEPGVVAHRADAADAGSGDGLVL